MLWRSLCALVCAYLLGSVSGAIVTGSGAMVTDRADWSERSAQWLREAAHAGMLATIPLVAHKGRASYLGERSIGHQDPGATSVMFMIQELAAAAKE
mgnify:CR=1 FL=1